MVNRRWIVAMVIALVSVAGLVARAPQDDDAVWKAFMTWFKTAPAVRGNPVAAYTAVLQKAGTPEAEVKRQAGVLMRQIMSGRSDWIEPFYDMTFSKLLTGDPATDGFTGEPSALLIETVKGLTPGTALDAGMGQGRNAVYLAGKGWKATGFDLSAEAIKSAQANAAKAGVRIDAVKASYADFDFGTAKWDLIVLTFAWAPMTDEAFVARLRTSLRPNGRIVFEHFIEDQERPRPSAMQALKRGQLRELLKGFRFDRYEEITGLADWAGPDTPMVRAVAVKQ